MRGVQKQNSSTTTTSFSGVFENDNSRSEFYKMVNNR
jgi:GTP cyclohydrolase I